MGHALCVPCVAVRVVRELGCPGKIVPSSPDPGVARVELTEPLGVVSTRPTLRGTYVLHADGRRDGLGIRPLLTVTGPSPMGGSSAEGSGGGRDNTAE